MRWTRGILTTTLVAVISVQSANAQSLPTAPGEAAFGAISEVVRLLKADPNTDWSKVHIEGLRQHLIDMDDVVMRAVVAQRDIPGGALVTVTARNASDTRMVDRIRGLGFAGLLADGDHHAMHHMMLARGSAMMR
jgi:hypothetical protein